VANAGSDTTETTSRDTTEISVRDDEQPVPGRAPSEPDVPESRYTRLNVNLNEETATALKEIARKRDVSVTEAIRRAIAILKFIEDETAAGHRIQIADARSGKVREIVLM
jgi:predicted transcriptional regulator